MAYKDKDKQREANREASKRRRDRAKGMTRADDNVIPVIPKQPENVIPNYGQPDCMCMHCQQNRNSSVLRGRLTINHGQYKTARDMAENEVNRVTLPGDPDYAGVCLDSKYDSRRRAI